MLALLVLLAVISQPISANNETQILTSNDTISEINAEKQAWMVSDVFGITPSAFDFKCLSETAVHLSEEKVCNGIEDCPDGSDETEETCLSVVKTCPPGQHKCRNESRCLTHENICDGKKDCQNGWDESESAGCPVRHMIRHNESSICQEGHSACDLPINRCIPDDAVCDFRKDCESGEDENNCPSGKKCPRGMFHCYRTGEEETKFYFHCIAKDQVCNKIPNCPNKEDENDATCQMLSVTENVGHSGNDGQHHYGNKIKGLEGQPHLQTDNGSNAGITKMTFNPVVLTATLFLLAGMCFLE